MKETKIDRAVRLFSGLSELGFSYSESKALLRIERTLQRWAEAECGDSNDSFSRGIERDEATGKPFWVIQFHSASKVRRTPTADREAAALKRLALIFKARNGRFEGRNGVADDVVLAYHQGDCRGCMLYILRKSEIKDGESIDAIYSRGLAVCL